MEKCPAEVSEPSYQIEIDVARNLVRTTLSGYWDEPLFRRFTKEFEQAFAKLVSQGYRPGSHHYLCDAREHSIQSQEVMVLFEGTAVYCAETVRRCALLMTGSLHRMQSGRLASTDQFQFFSLEDEALAWLFADDKST